MIRRKVLFACFAPIFALAAGCTTAGKDTPGRSNAPQTNDGSATLASPLRISITVPAVPPGEEGTKCIKVLLGNADAVDIGEIHNTLSPASHHLVVSAVTDPTETESGLFDCRPFRAVLIGAPLTVTQKHDDVIRMPEGVAFPLAARQLMHLEMHYINTGTETQDVTAVSELYPLASPGSVQEASFLIVGNLDIQIPPHSKYETPSAYVELPEAFADVNFYAATGHTHRFGTRATLAVAAGDAGPTTTIYDPQPFSWTDAELEYFDPPVKVPPGGGFRFDCAWDNPTDTTVTYGESALQEMCFFWTYYYPRRDGNRVMLAGLDKSPYAHHQDAGAN
jgi:hypothetical protein